MIKILRKLTGYILPALLIVAMALPLTAIPVSAATTPVLSSISVSDITVSTAKINYTLDSGGENCQVYIGYGHVNVYGRGSSFIGDTTNTNTPEPDWINRWDFVIDVGSKSSGTYYEDLSSLWRGKVIASTAVIYYGIYVYNSEGSDEEHGYFDNIQDLIAPEINFETGHDSTNLFASTRWQAQTFTTTDAIDITMVSLWTTIYSDETYIVGLKAVDVDGKPTGDYLGSGSVSETFSESSYSWKEYWFETPISLSAATEYAIVLHSTETTYYNGWYVDTDNGFAGGRAWRSDSSEGTVWTYEEEYVNYDNYFRLYTRGAYSSTEYCGGYTYYLEDTDITETTATLRGYLDYIGGVDTDTMIQQDATVSFEYGTTTAYGSETTPEDISPEMPYVYSEEILGLSAGTTYHYRFTATNNMGEVNFADRIFVTRDISEEGKTAISGALVTLPNQHNSFYAEGKYWLFNMVERDKVAYETSSNGISWTEPSVVIDGVSEFSFAVTFDGVYFHLIAGESSEPLYYRMGKPNNDGTVTWQAALQEALPKDENPADNHLWTTPSIVTDANGYPWIISGICSAGTDTCKIVITASSTKDGTWTTKSGFPTIAGDIFGNYYQRGSLVALDNGCIYAIAGKRGKSAWNFNKWVESGGEVLSGSLWNGSSWSEVENVSTTRMQWIGDAALDTHLLWSVTSFGNDVYVAFTNIIMTTAPDSTHNIKFIKRSWGVGWGTEETLQADVLERTAPILAVDDSDGSMYCFWGNSPDLNKVYYKKRSGSSWDASPTAWKFENLLQGSGIGDSGLFAIQAWERATEGQICIYYNIANSTYSDPSAMSDTNMHGGVSGLDIRIAFMGTGFSVSTDTPAVITTTSATLQGHLVNDGGESSSVRFQWGLTASYGSDTTWQSGMETGDTFNQPITGLSPNTIYHFRAQARHADLTIVSGADRTFTATSIGNPTITTGTANLVAETSAALQGTLTSLGDYSPVYVYFQYGLSTSYGSATVEQTKTSTGGYNQAITGLTTNTTYHFRSVVRYNGTNYIYGNDATFTTSTAGLQPPTNFTATRGDTTIALSWVRASGATNTLVRRSTTGFPTTTSSGVLVYNGTGISKTDTGLTNSQAYYYSAWSESGGVYSTTYATVYSPAAGTGAGVLPPPDYIWICNVLVLESYQTPGDQLVVFEYRLDYATTPTESARDFFAFEVWDGATLVARSPVMDWGTRPGSVYLSPSSALVWGQSFTLKLVGLASQWASPVPSDSQAVNSWDWTNYRDDFSVPLRSWCIMIAGIIDPAWVMSTPTGDVLSDEACVIFNRAIPALSSRISDLCSTSSGFVDVEPQTHTDDYQQTLTEDNLGPDVTGLFDDAAGLFGMDEGIDFGAMLIIFLAVAGAIAVGFFTRSVAFSLIVATIVMGGGVYGGLVSLAWVMIVGGILAMYMLYVFFARGT